MITHKMPASNRLFFRFSLVLNIQQRRASLSLRCVWWGDFCSHVSSNSFSIGKYPFFIYEIELKKFARKKQKSLEKSRLFRAISFLSPFDGLPDRIRTYGLKSRSLVRYPATLRAEIFGYSVLWAFYYTIFFL